MEEAEKPKVSEQDEESPEIFAYDSDGEVSRIYGTFEGNVTLGVSLYIEPNESTDPEKLKFKVKELSITSKLLSMKLEFENPAYVSSQSQSEKDVLVINLNDFRDQDDKLIVDSQVIKKELPN